MTKLSVNVNKIATLRNSRGKDLPNILKVALDIERFGAQGITVHPRPDERHIRRQDVFDLKGAISTELNVEGYPSDDFLKLIDEVRPAQCTLVPDPPHVLTSNAGWRVLTHREILQRTAKFLNARSVRCSVFVDPRHLSDKEAQMLAEIGVDRVELYTEEYADAYATARRAEVTARYVECAQKCREVRLGINAGHDLNLNNLRHLRMEIPFLDEVSIGHALIADALYLGLEETIRRYLKELT